MSLLASLRNRHFITGHRDDVNTIGLRRAPEQANLVVSGAVMGYT